MAMKDLAASTGQDALTRLEGMEAELAALRQELDHCHQLATLGTLTAGIAHEINNILTPVLAYAQLARANPHDRSMATKAIERAIAGVESSSRITEAVLGFARRDDQPDRADVGEIVQASLACIGRDPARDGIQLSVSIDARLEVRIRPLALQQVLMNLMLNAMTAMRGRSGDLRVTAKPAPDGMARIVVSDTGPGIAEPVRETIFDPFVSGSKRRRPESDDEAPRLGGSGLGLAVCKRLVENVGGTIRVESTVGEGATFTITLPAYANAGSDAA